jgi:hypothetical protein
MQKTETPTARAMARGLDMVTAALARRPRVTQDLAGYDLWLDQQNSFEKEQRDEERYRSRHNG